MTVGSSQRKRSKKKHCKGLGSETPSPQHNLLSFHLADGKTPWSSGNPKSTCRKSAPSAEGKVGGEEAEDPEPLQELPQGVGFQQVPLLDEEESAPQAKAKG